LWNSREGGRVKIIAQNYRSGELALVEAPAPTGRAGGLLVRTEFSLISVGTEMMKVSEAKLSLLGKARARPDQARKVLANIAKEGPQATLTKVMNRLDSYTPLGYSLAGVVVEVGPGVTGFHVGQRVACAGNQFALHAELNWVPANLCVPVPDSVDPRHAAFSAVGAIAMQGLRQAELGLGDVAVVIGLGLVGQLLVRLLVANGIRVVGLDPSGERCRLAERGGADGAASPDGPGVDAVSATLAELSDGFGADAVFISAGGKSNQPAELAAALARDRGRIVDIGKCSLDLPWNAYYDKELDVRFSRSYGAGRYDPLYEEGGIDYPIGYVRWTEGRNLACFIDLLARKQVDIEPLVSSVVDFADAVQTYKALESGELEGVGFLFEFAQASPLADRVTRPKSAGTRRVQPTGGVVRVGFIGAGNYASTMLLPHLAKRADVELRAVATRTSLSSANAQRKFGFEHAFGDHAEMLRDDGIDAVFVVTRHNSHAQLVCEALRAGKAVFVEKPLALTDEQLDRIVETVAETGNDRLMVGFNRRFAPMLGELRNRFGPRKQPAMVRYTVNAGTLERGSWYLDADAEGTRFVGEGGHFIDTCSWWLGAEPVRVHAVSSAGRSDDVQTTMEYDDGSIAAITYSTAGPRRFPKETFEVIADGRVARLENFMRASLWTERHRKRLRPAIAPDKGQGAEVAAFVDAVRTAGPMPTPLTSLVATTAATLAVGTSVSTGMPVTLERPQVVS
jgi:predicted dehydrogenase/threonine dehydrogenase-like Zn-dependent dehydrogenase